MPNVGHPDYVAVHKHSASDFQGLQGLVAPPTQVAEPTTSGPTTDAGTWNDLSEMELTFTPPTASPLWEVRLQFSGQFALTGPSANGGVNIRLEQDGTAIDNTTREMDAETIAPFNSAVEATVVVAGGTEVTFTVGWQSRGASEVTATGVQRSFSAVLRPFIGV